VGSHEVSNNVGPRASQRGPRQRHGGPGLAYSRVRARRTHVRHRTNCNSCSLPPTPPQLAGCRQRRPLSARKTRATTRTALTAPADTPRRKRNACAHQQSASTVCTPFVRVRYVPHELAALMPMWRHITRPTPRSSCPREISEIVIASVATRVLEIAKIAEIVVRGGHGGRRSGRCCKHPRGLTCFRRGREQAATRRRG